jgi:polar amino acid transport system permease protein
MRSRTATTDLPVLLRVAPLPSGSGMGEIVRAIAELGWRAPALAFAIPLLWVAAADAAAGDSRPSAFAAAIKWMPLIASGFAFNLAVSVAAMAAGTAAGLFLGFGTISRIAPIRGCAWAATQFFRNSPWLVLLFFAMFLLPFELRVGPYTIPLPAWLKAIFGLSLPVMANVAEIVRGGVQSIPVGQWESAEALAFSRRQTLWQIILPQAVKRMLPPWMNLYAILTMATTLISVVGIQDSMTLTRAALVAEGRPDLFLPFYFMLLLMFFTYCYPIALFTAHLERRFAVRT